MYLIKLNQIWHTYSQRYRKISLKFLCHSVKNYQSYSTSKKLLNFHTKFSCVHAWDTVAFLILKKLVNSVYFTSIRTVWTRLLLLTVQYSANVAKKFHMVFFVRTNLFSVKLVCRMEHFALRLINFNKKLNN